MVLFLPRDIYIYVHSFQMITFQCPLCDENYSSIQELSTHSVQHALKTVRCRQSRCKKDFTTEAAINVHLFSHHKFRHICKQCDKILSSKNALRQHIICVHSTETPFICNTCNKAFKTLSRLQTHKYVHNVEKKFVCSYCGYSTKSGGDLNVHTRIHTSERPYKCNYVNCGREFKTSSHLSEHIRRHMQIKNYVCNICLQSFGQHSTLKTHLMQHTGEKPYRCDYCLACFRRKHHLTTHLKTHEMNL